MPPRKKKAEPASLGLGPLEVPGEDLGTGFDGAEAPKEVRELALQIADDDGAVLATYRDPFGSRWVLFAALPIDRVEPTPYQRELSPTHAERLAAVIPKVGQYLDPVVAVRHDGGYWTPNGMHRLSAMKSLGQKTIMALVVPDPNVAYRILALNTEKAHNLKDKSTEVWRMARGLADDELLSDRPESDWAFEFEEASYLPIGACYEARPRFSGAVYQPILKRCCAFSERAIAETVPEHAERTETILAVDDAVIEAVNRCKEAGLQSPYLKAFVVAHVNPLRFSRPKPGQKAEPADLEKTLAQMLERAGKLDASKVRPQDLASAASAAPSE